MKNSRPVHYRISLYKPLYKNSLTKEAVIVVTSNYFKNFGSPISLPKGGRLGNFDSSTSSKRRGL